MSPTKSSSSRTERFRHVYAATYDDVLRFVQRRVDPSHAEDVAAEAFMVVWCRIDDLPAIPGNARAWMFGIARNCILADRRGDVRRDALAVRIAQHHAIDATGGDASVPDQDLLARRLDVARAWTRLTPGEQEVLALHIWDELTSPQAALVLGITSVAYRLRLSRARAALRRHLDADASLTHPTVVAPQEISS